MIFDDITGAVGQVQSWAEQQWAQRIVQISVYASILFFVLSSFDLINTVDKQILKVVGVKLGKDGTRVIHAITLGVFMYVGIHFILDPFVKRFINGQIVEGGGGGKGANTDKKCSDVEKSDQSGCKDWSKTKTYKAEASNNDRDTACCGDSADDGDASAKKPAKKPAVACEGSWSDCGKNCKAAERVWTPKRGKPEGCQIMLASDANSTPPPCKPGNGKCPDAAKKVDCAGTWSDCTKACETKAERKFTTTKKQSGGGQACPPNPGNCGHGDGKCIPPNLKCSTIKGGKRDCSPGTTFKGDKLCNTWDCHKKSAKNEKCCVKDSCPTYPKHKAGDTYNLSEFKKCGKQGKKACSLKTLEAEDASCFQKEGSALQAWAEQCDTDGTFVDGWQEKNSKREDWDSCLDIKNLPDGFDPHGNWNTYQSNNMQLVTNKENRAKTWEKYKLVASSTDENDQSDYSIDKYLGWIPKPTKPAATGN